MIHPTAIIHPDAFLGAGVQIGPYAVIEGAARIGDGCIIHAHAIIGAHVTMGQENTVGHGAVVGGDPHDLAFRPEMRSEVRIGDRNRIRELCTVHRGTGDDTVTTIGDDCYLMAGAHVGHNSTLGNHVILANNVLLGGHVSIADRVFLGGGSALHQYVRVGVLAFSMGMSRIGKDVPPYTMASELNGVAALNSVGLRRAGLGLEQRSEIKRAFLLFYRSGRNAAQAIAAAAEERWGAEGAAFWAFVGTKSKRGICDYLGTRPE